MTAYSLAILLFSILFCTVTTVLAVMLRRSNRRKDLLLAEMQAAMTLPVGMDEREQQSASEQSGALFEDTFRNNLQTAELTTRLQQPRLSAQQGIAPAAAPERYRYLQGLVESGLSAQEIASTLSMSLPEVTQLITLIRVANPQQRPTEKPEPFVATAKEVTLTATTTQKLPEQYNRQGGNRQRHTPKTAGAVHASGKLARWYKRLQARSLTPCLRKQSGREPPTHALPPRQGVSCHPLPGYT